jgi:hypothetical protein
MLFRPAWPPRYACFVPFIALFACSSTSTPPPDDPPLGDTCTPVVAVDASLGTSGAASCASPGEATPGPKDTHCASPDGGITVQSTRQASCCVMGDAGGPGTCPYSATMFGHEGDDDDCKYHVAWTSSPICEGAGGVEFSVVATYLGTGKPVTGANIRPETATTTPPNDAGCDDMGTHLSPSTFSTFAEDSPGTYKGRIVFDRPGAWTVRFHLFENCFDVLPDSPHGHAAFRLSVP